MKKTTETKQVLDNIKSAVSGMSATEKENFRDNLLAFLLFGDHHTPINKTEVEPLMGITAQEKELIRKLAAQTEELYRVMNNDQPDTEYQ